MTIKNIHVRFRKLSPEAKTPTVARRGDAGADLYAIEDGTLAPGESAPVGTGIALELPEGTVGLIHPRSGLALKHGIGIVNAPATIDSGYRGEIKILLINLGSARFSFRAGERIAQLLVQEYLEPTFAEVSELSGTERGVSGFGSTGRA